MVQSAVDLTGVSQWTNTVSVSSGTVCIIVTLDGYGKWLLESSCIVIHHSFSKCFRILLIWWVSYRQQTLCHCVSQWTNTMLWCLTVNKHYVLVSHRQWTLSWCFTVNKHYVMVSHRQQALCDGVSQATNTMSWCLTVNRHCVAVFWYNMHHCDPVVWQGNLDCLVCPVRHCKVCPVPVATPAHLACLGVTENLERLVCTGLDIPSCWLNLPLTFTSLTLTPRDWHCLTFLSDLSLHSWPSHSFLTDLDGPSRLTLTFLFWCSFAFLLDCLAHIE